MIRRHRGVLALLLLTVLASVGGVAAWQVAHLSLAHPTHASSRQLMLWLVWRDLHTEPADVRLALVDRLEQELRHGRLASASAAERLSGSQRAQLTRNVLQLQRDWFFDRTRQYAAQPADGRADFLLRQLETIDLWTSAAPGNPDSSGGWSQAVANIQRWMDEAGEEDRERMERAVRDGLVCWLATYDLAGYPDAARLDLAERIAGSGASSASTGELYPQLDASQQDRLRTNGQLLLQTWLEAQADRYYQLPREERTGFIDSRIEQVQQCAAVRWLTRPEGQTPQQQQGLIGMLKLVDQTIDQADPAQQDRLRGLATHVQQRLVWKQLQNLLKR